MSGTGVRRREVLGGVALAGAVGAFGVARLLPRGNAARVVLFDGGRPASRAFARTSAAARRIDLAEDAGMHWRALRSLDRAMPVAGYTPWSSYVAARGWLEEQGLRLVSERLDRRNGLVIWSMA